jgi:hypothetical protein
MGNQPTSREFALCAFTRQVLPKRRDGRPRAVVVEHVDPVADAPVE